MSEKSEFFGMRLTPDTRQSFRIIVAASEMTADRCLRLMCEAIEVRLYRLKKKYGINPWDRALDAKLIQSILHHDCGRITDEELMEKCGKSQKCIMMVEQQGKIDAKKSYQQRPMTDVPKRFLSVEETAVYLGISPRSIYNQIHRKAKKKFPIRCKRIGKLIKFDIRDLEKYMESLENEDKQNS